jgi:hypothetical protein
MKQKTRELLVTTKAAQHWHSDFEQKVEELMDMVNRVDNDRQIQHASETLDVYHNSQKPTKAAKKRKLVHSDRPFEFLVFRN